MTCYHLRDIAQGKRKIIKSANVKTLGVPLFEGLSTEDILKWAEKYPDVYRALPIERREIDKLHRKYIINVVYTIVGEPFKKWVDKVMDQRN